jgi:hypothetical protein
MARNRRRTPTRYRAPLRQFIWARYATSLIVPTEGGINRDILEDFEAEYGADLVGATVVRIRGIIALSTPSGEQGSDVVVAAGIRVYGERNTPSNSDNLASEPGPFSGPHADWMMYKPIFMGTTLGYVEREVEIDVKANRKIEELGQSLMISLEQDSAASTAANTAYDAFVNLSLGLKLP